MFFPRPHGHVASLLRLSATAFLLLLIFQAADAKAQELPTPSSVPPSSQSTVPGAVSTQNSTPPALPAAVQVPNSVRPALPPYAPGGLGPRRDILGSAYIPVDSIVYPMALRLYSMGYLDTAFILMRPWTRQSLLHMLEKSSPAIIAGGNDQAIDLLAKLDNYLAAEGAEDATTEVHFDRGNVYGVQQLYTRVMGISGQTLRDSYHLGQTIAQDYGRPYEPGFNNITGFATLNEWWRLSLYVRGEYQYAPASYGYSINPSPCNPNSPIGLVERLSAIDEVEYCSPYNANQATIPSGSISTVSTFRLQEATLSFHLLGMEISGGKSDSWDGPGLGSAMIWSNNAENIYAFRINRVEPLYIPWVSKVMGPLRYDFFVGSVQGHTSPNAPWLHSETFSFAPTSNFQFAFSRTVIWGGHGHGCLEPDGSIDPCNQPITLHTFFHSFFSFNDTSGAQKYSVNDPGARYSSFSFSYRLPFVRHHLLLYLDSISHDDVSPISAPRRAAYRPGIFLSQFPGLPKFDLRVEAANTDCSTTACTGGTLNYWEAVQKQGYTNKGFIMGDWIGREAIGGQAWLTYHLSANEWVQFEYLTKRTHNDFIPGGVTQNQYQIDVVKRLAKDVELNAWVQLERWKAPIYILKENNGANFDNVVAVQVTWYPKLRNDVKNRAPDTEP
jgi:Capsule assembly protein Wzi